MASKRNELRSMLSKCRNAFMGVAVLSGLNNVLMLTGSIFMLAVYDRVIPSNSVPSLIGLGILAAVMYIFQGVVEVARSRVLSRIGAAIQEASSGRLFDIIVRTARNGPEGATALRDLEQLRGYLSSLGPTAFFDLPWIPIFIVICFLFHPLIGITVIAGAVLLIVIAGLSDAFTKGPSQALAGSQSRKSSLVSNAQRSADTIVSMGMSLGILQIWTRNESEIIGHNGRLADITSILASIARTFRMLLQSFVLAVGAYLVINHEATGGIMIASSILSSRALAPIELTISQWKNFVAARQSWTRLNEVFNRVPAEAFSITPMPPKHELTVEDVTVGLQNAPLPILRNVTFRAGAGSGLGIVGPSGSGKTTLARSLVGLTGLTGGAIRLDGASLFQWPSIKRGQHIGYLPQDITFFDGTIAENIARFDLNASSASVTRAAMAAGVHDLIVSFPQGYETRLAEGSGGISAGQRQRIALARALYGDPFLVVLDEPNSNLDGDGENSLMNAIRGVKARGGVVVVIAHRPSLLSAIDFVVVLNKGQVQAYGERDQILDRLIARPAEPESASVTRMKTA